MGKQFVQVSERESTLIRDWHKKKGYPVSKIMELMGRAKQTVLNHIHENLGEGSGRPIVITKAALGKLERNLKLMQRRANAHREISVKAVKERAGVEACDRSVLDAFHEDGIYFRPLRQKPILTDDDVVDRDVFGKANKDRPKEAWITQPDAIIDNKHFKIYNNAVGRDEAARRQIRGGYRRRGDPPMNCLVKRKPSMKFPAQGVQVTAAVVNGRIRMFDFVDGKWNGNAAAKMYTGPLLRTLRKAFPGKAARRSPKWTVLEDNDPTGYKSSKGLAAKASVGIASMNLPKRSPDFNPLDFSLWAAINKAMVKQEATFRKGKKETKEAYKKRLRKTALSLPTAIVKNSVMDMRRRCQEVVKAQGGLFEK